MYRINSSKAVIKDQKLTHTPLYIKIMTHGGIVLDALNMLLHYVTPAPSNSTAVCLGNISTLQPPLTPIHHLVHQHKHTRKSLRLDKAHG